MDLNDGPLLNASPNDMAVAPELAVLVALDAALAAAACQLFVANDVLGPEVSVPCCAPSQQERTAGGILLLVHDLRVSLREYRNLTLHDDPDNDASF